MTAEQPDQPSVENVQEQIQEPATPAVVTAAPVALALATPPAPDPLHAATERLRSEFAEVANVAAQAARLGVTVDAADAVRKGISADTLRRTVLETLASRAEASSVIAAAPTGPAAVGESPIVRRAKDRAAASARS